MIPEAFVSRPLWCFHATTLHYNSSSTKVHCATKSINRHCWFYVQDKTEVIDPSSAQNIKTKNVTLSNATAEKFRQNIKSTLEPRSLKMISTSRILPNCCKDTVRRKTFYKHTHTHKCTHASTHTHTHKSTSHTNHTYAKHLSEIRISKSEGDVGHMKSLGLGLTVCAFRYRLCWWLTICLSSIICLLGNKGT